jgi:phosphate transport system permease protein
MDAEPSRTRRKFSAMSRRRLFRKIRNGAFLTLSVVATSIGLICLAAILWTLVARGISGLSASVFTQMTPPPGSQGGLLNAIFGSLVMTGLGILMGAPIGMLAGTYLAEYGRHSRLSFVIRFINDILLSAPSIIIGLFIYEVVVVHMGHFSAFAGAVALAVIAIPVSLRTTEDMLNLVPGGMKDASAALGAYPWRTVLSVVYPAARSGIVTGLLLAIARVSGETAPLLFTALNNQFWSSQLNAPMANLPVVIFQFALSPYKEWQDLAWAGALLITVTILVLSVSARIVLGLMESGQGPKR